ncbi:hypothetical protein [Streptomyces sp. NPDC050535]|uniref:hypothetical protein n=1 Tax=Streptomyces sp. NPDC050535 TaxID=3365626 RepID=UPI0037B95578
MALRRAVSNVLAVGALVAGSTLGLSSVASAAPAGATDLSCPYMMICGEAPSGGSFAFKACRTFGLTNMVGIGEVNNNQTPGTKAKLYGRNMELLYTLTAPESFYITWDNVWYVKPC